MEFIEWIFIINLINNNIDKRKYFGNNKFRIFPYY